MFWVIYELRIVSQYTNGGPGWPEVPGIPRQHSYIRNKFVFVDILFVFADIIFFSYFSRNLKT